jgi:hypothetical protein
MNAISYDEGVAPAAPALMPPVAITAIDEDNGLFPADGITRDNTLFIVGTAAPGSPVTVTRIGTGVIGVTSANGSGDWIFDYTGTVLPDGTHQFRVSAIDPSNGQNFTSDPFTVIVSTVAADAPTIGSVHAVSGGLLVLGEAAPHSLVTVFLDGSSDLGTTTADSGGSWSFNFAGPPEDAHGIGVPQGSERPGDVAIDQGLLGSARDRGEEMLHRGPAACDGPQRQHRRRPHVGIVREAGHQAAEEVLRPCTGDRVLPEGQVREGGHGSREAATTRDGPVLRLALQGDGGLLEALLQRLGRNGGRQGEEKEAGREGARHAPILRCPRRNPD